MNPEDILIEAEKLGLRQEILNRVHNLRKEKPSIGLYNAYEEVWDNINKNTSQ